MTGLFRALFVLLLLATPLAVVAALPRLFDLAGSIEPSDTQAPRFIQPPAVRLERPTLTTVREPSVRDESPPPPTLIPAARTASPAATATAAPTGERISIGNTGGQGAVLRAEPVTGPPVAALRDSQVLDVL